MNLKKNDSTINISHLPENIPGSAAPSGKQRPMKARVRNIIVRGALLFAIFVGVIGELGWWRVIATETQFSGNHFNLGLNATWLAHTWVGAYHTQAEYQDLFTLLIHEQIHFIYVHAGPLNGDGSDSPQLYPFAGAFIRAARIYGPNIKVLAWLGQLYVPNSQPSDGVLNIALAATRKQIAATSAYFTHSLGFDGVHLDIEPIPNNDPHFLDLLSDIRQSIGPQPILSLSTPNWIAIARIAVLMSKFTDRDNYWWTTYYYRKVGQYANQIVVMLYNTDMPTAPLYEALVEQETAHIIRDVQFESPTTKVLIGLPTYTGNSKAFHSSAENITTGLTGVINGLNYESLHTAFAGVAIYPEWLTTPADWDVYNTLWL